MTDSPLVPKSSPRDPRRPTPKPRLRGRGASLVRAPFVRVTPPWWALSLMTAMAALAIAMVILTLALVTGGPYRPPSSPQILAPSPAPIPPTDTGYPATMAALAAAAVKVAEDANTIARLAQPTPYPTATSYPVPTATPLMPLCTNPTPGMACLWPTATPLPTVTATPLPSCSTPENGAMCLWPTPVPAVPWPGAPPHRETSAMRTPALDGLR